MNRKGGSWKPLWDMELDRDFLEIRSQQDDFFFFLLYFLINNYFCKGNMEGWHIRLTRYISIFNHLFINFEELGIMLHSSVPQILTSCRLACTCSPLPLDWVARYNNTYPTEKPRNTHEFVWLVNLKISGRNYQLEAQWEKREKPTKICVSKHGRCVMHGYNLIMYQNSHVNK